MNGWAIFFILLLVLIPVAYFGWYFYARWNAGRNGLPPPSMNPIAAFKNRSAEGESNYPGPAPTGIKGFFDTQVHKFKNRNNRTAAGAYEEPAYGSQQRGRGAGSRLDPDEAWSARVGDEAYYEEQELGLHEPSSTRANPYANTTYTAPYPAAAEPERGRSRTRESYDERNDGRSGQTNPFGDENAASLRGVSPRPLGHEDDTGYHGGATVQMPKGPKPGKAASMHSLPGDSPTDGRRSVFKEDIR
ncbi:hypothetical protein GQ44DRAFT_602584 [Phaeosphaeriaceae sp. PMI808]|nr:hypothetical protein GQ44DRAFT_602584 [Phaeosphaeriaceae sp. PMI808]